MHAIEKILAKHSGRKTVTAGEIVTVNVDFAEINDLYLQTVISFYEMNGKKVWDNNKLCFCFDHYAPCPTIKTADNHTQMRRFAKEQGLTHHFDTNAGVCHQVMPEAGLVYPGMIIVATDSHTTTHGAFGALGTGCGATDMAAIMVEGQTWMRVPEIIEVRLEGQPAAGVYAKDVILSVLKDIKATGAIYKAIAFTGSYVDSIGVPERMTICNMAVEMGAKTAYMQPNAKVLEYVKARCNTPFEVEYTDSDYVYGESHVYDVSKLVPQVSCPHSVDNVHDITEVTSSRVMLNQGYLGSCTNGRLEDLAVAASILKGRHIAPYTRLVVVPASARILEQAMEKGYIKTFIDAGATIGTPGCAACLGTHMGIIGKDEVCITSTNRNFVGRMGSNKASLYLASPATVTASLVNGYITDPREFLA